MWLSFFTPRGLTDIAIPRTLHKRVEQIEAKLQQFAEQPALDFVNPPPVLSGLSHHLNHLFQTCMTLEKLAFRGDHHP